MNTVMGVSGTTACMPLSLLNDEATGAVRGRFCIQPRRYASALHFRQAGFYVNPTFPYDGEVMVSHCTAPRRMDGVSLEPARIVTHYESISARRPRWKCAKGSV